MNEDFTAQWNGSRARAAMRRAMQFLPASPKWLREIDVQPPTENLGAPIVRVIGTDGVVWDVMAVHSANISKQLLRVFPKRVVIIIHRTSPADAIRKVVIDEIHKRGKY